MHETRYGFCKKDNHLKNPRSQFVSKQEIQTLPIAVMNGIFMQHFFNWIFSKNIRSDFINKNVFVYVWQYFIRNFVHIK